MFHKPRVRARPECPSLLGFARPSVALQNLMVFGQISDQDVPPSYLSGRRHVEGTKDALPERLKRSVNSSGVYLGPPSRGSSSPIRTHGARSSQHTCRSGSRSMGPSMEASVTLTIPNCSISPNRALPQVPQKAR